MGDYLAQLTLNQEDTYTRPFEIITPNIGIHACLYLPFITPSIMSSLRVHAN